MRGPPLLANGAVQPYGVSFDLAADKQISLPEANDVGSTTRSLFTRIAAMDIWYDATTVRRKSLVKAVRKRLSGALLVYSRRCC
ncbi:Serine/threonine-protein kinase mTOR [Gossypium arboreum]|uniref:Serine/threonine-protein kinase mTOR n=1 Tax=Gossypium arboreum TaxID=29729 RepID=A0A0B0NYI5_GOSAR|nr:Serine/threonine-protein kinase mTOR [Gossypium arboreum]